MFSLCQFAGATVLGAALLLGPGCSHREPPIPANAMLVTEGDGRLAYTSPNTGTVFVYDETKSVVVWSGHVSKGQALMVEPANDRITLDGQVVQETGLTRGNNHRVFLQKDIDTPSRATSVEETRIERTVNP